MSFWPQERISQLTELWAKGLTGKEIAAIMGDGLSRSAVLGAVHRYRLPTRIIEYRPPINAQPVRHRPPSKTFREVVALAKQGVHPKVIARQLGKTKQCVYGVIARARRQGEAIPYHAPSNLRRYKKRPAYSEPVAAKPKPVFVADGEPSSLNLTIMDLSPGQCRWPHGDGPFTFCGHSTHNGRAYCAFHCAAAYQPPAGKVYVGRAA